MWTFSSGTLLSFSSCTHNSSNLLFFFLKELCCRCIEYVVQTTDKFIRVHKTNPALPMPWTQLEAISLSSFINSYKVTLNIGQSISYQSAIIFSTQIRTSRTCHTLQSPQVQYSPTQILTSGTCHLLLCHLLRLRDIYCFYQIRKKEKKY